ncbi:MAG: 4a-hydroxytetrahydrobiopterin dehydratase [Candidatus Caenarcaniphilales bacterium]|nr:4a-hydroxytetrahydrobiopterin dehydratase [Candidatus Caenarcaniphilales bacterium]
MQRLNSHQIDLQLEKSQGWKKLLSSDGLESISKNYKFDSYLEGIDFVNEVAQLAEKDNHHPDMLVKWCKVTVTLSTHDAQGLTDKDFSLARKIDLEMDSL